MQVAYFVNQYPKVSHTFIRREILALEQQGFAVQRIALRGWDADVVDPADRAERERTQYVLRHGLRGLAAAVLRAAWRRPARLLRSLRWAVRLSRHNERGLPYHLIYVAEACRVVEWAEAGGATHLHAHFGTNSAEVALLARVLGGPTYSFTVHGPEEFDKPQGIHLSEKIAQSSFVVAISSFCRSQLYRWAQPAQWNKIQVVRCGVEAEFHAEAQTAANTSRQLVCVGRLSEQKGHLLLIEAAHILALEGEAFSLVLAGDGELRAALEAEINRRGLQPFVTITGWIDSAQVRRFMLASRALVVSSFAEGLPVVVMEAMTLRRPVIGTLIAGIPELVEDGRSGWLCAAGDAVALASAMRRCLAADEADLVRMGEQARAAVLERHDVRHEAARLGALFRDAAAGARP
ncbi:glycosyltransferase [Thiomonas intermedia]|uniref:glycosyltransferase n=1 Tax=Thiomonas intermedia TaxID=926 RepID=UPI0009A52BF5|nr:glycosyltransferase [Thiomonas intermedia]